MKTKSKILLIISISLLSSTSSISQTSKIAVDCTEEEIVKYALNYRRIALLDAPFLFSKMDSIVSSTIDSTLEVNEVLERWKLKTLGNNTSFFTQYLDELLSQTKRLSNHNDDELGPFIFSLPFENPNAKIIKYPKEHCDEKIIFVNEGFVSNIYSVPRSTLNLISLEVLLDSNKVNYKKQEEYFDEQNKKIRSEFIALWNKDAVDGDMNQAAIIWHYMVATYMYLIAHEYGHGFLKHRGSNSVHQSDNEISYSWSQELEADYFAAKVILRYSQSQDNGLPLPYLLEWGGDYFFTFMDFYSFQDKMTSIMLLSNDSIDTFRKLKQLAKRDIPKINYQNLDSLTILLNKVLPKEPKLKHFERIINKLNKSNGFKIGSHPPSYLRRAIARVALLRNSQNSSLVMGSKNFGDLYWKYFARSYSIIDHNLDRILPE